MAPHHDSGWTASNNSIFWGMSRNQGLRSRLGTFPIEGAVASRIAFRSQPQGMVFQDNFDCRDRWGPYIGGVIDQGNCGSSWAISTSGNEDILGHGLEGKLRP